MFRRMIKLTPDQLPHPGQESQVQLHLAYRVGPRMELQKSRGLPGNLGQGGQILGLLAPGGPVTGPVEPLCEQILEEAHRQHYAGILCYFPGLPDRVLAQVVGELSRRCHRSGLDLLVTEGYSGQSQGLVLLSSALCGGTLEERFARLGQELGPGRILMELQQMGEDFLLPAPRGCGQKVSPREIQVILAREGAQTFFSPELCARYFTYQNQAQSLRFVLYDDAGTVAEKIRLAEKWGLAGVVE